MKPTDKKENFAELLELDLQKRDLKSGAVVDATIVDIRADHVLVDAGLKSEDLIPMREFRGAPIKVGDVVDVVVMKVENGFGETRLSYELARKAKSWTVLEKSYTDSETVQGTIIERVKGGFTVELDSIRAFLPGSLIDTKPVRDPAYLEGKELDFKIIKMDKKRNNIVVSRRAVMEAEESPEREAVLASLQEGQEIKGIVKNITDYGAFVDLGGVDGLLHITDMAWKRIKHPSELLNVGDEINVKILKFDRDKNRVSLGLKQLGEDPWENIAQRYPTNSRLSGKVTNITDYGCFVELQEGVEGLVHMSEMDWTNKNVHPSKIVQVGEEVEVMVLEIDEARRRISLGVKQCKSNPWHDFSQQHQKDEKITGKIRSITDFGVFIGLEGDIDGLVHLSDLSWEQPGEEAVRNFKRGEEVEAIILAIDPERERISLGIKQLQSDHLSEFVETTGKDQVINAKVISVDAKQAIVKLADDQEAVLRLSDYSFDKIRDLRESLKEGDEVDVKIINFDPKTRTVQVSHKVLESKPSETGARRAVTEDNSKTTLGDLLKEQMKDSKE